MFDLNSIAMDIENAVPMELLGPTGQPCFYADGEDSKKVIFDLLPQNSDKGTTVSRANLNRRLQSKRPVDAIMLENEQTEVLVACTVGWNGLVLDGKDFPYSESNARQLYSDPHYAYIRNQAQTFIGDAANFTKR